MELKIPYLMFSRTELAIEVILETVLNSTFLKALFFIICIHFAVGIPAIYIDGTKSIFVIIEFLGVFALLVVMISVIGILLAFLFDILWGIHTLHRDIRRLKNKQIDWSATEEIYRRIQ